MQVTKQLLKHYHSATKDQHQRGMGWYIKANEICVKLAYEYKVPLVQVVGIMAALSPNNKWERNIKDTESFLKNGMDAKVCTFGANKRKADDIKNLPTCLPYAVTAILKGPKTTAFFWNIYKPLQNHHVTLDMWALRAAGFSSKAKVKERRECDAAYREAAKKAGVRLHELQAVIWNVIREA